MAPIAARAWGLLMLLGLLMSPPSLSLAAEVRASLDQTRIYEGDRVLLTIEVAGEGAGGGFGRWSGEEPDLGPLHDDFEVLGVNTSQETRIVNGRRSDKTGWQVALAPKRLGRLEIPALRVGSATTEPLSLRVDAVPAGGLGAPGDEVWLEVELGADADAAADASSTEPLVVQQQVPLVVRAYSARPLIDYAIQMPQIEDAALTRIGRDQTRMSTRDGQQYRVIERRYTLSPERSGTLRIPPIIFEAELETERARQSPDSLARGSVSDLFNDPMFERMFGGTWFGPTGSLFERGEPARAQSEALVREVAARAEDFSGEHWLPATALEIRDSWNPAAGGDTPELRLGEPATRTLTLIARGLAGNQIPEIEVPAPDGFRVYPERTRSETRSDGETLIGISRQRLTLIPIRGGDVELPRIEVPWWHTGAGEERIATVPALDLTVAGAVVDAETLAGAGEAGADTEADAAQASARARSREASGQAGADTVDGGEGAGSDIGSDAGSDAATDTGSWALNRPWNLLWWALIALAAGLLWRHRRWLHEHWSPGR
ncbi:MAG: BatD family protein, partial [Halochromatium sp.]